MMYLGAYDNMYLGEVPKSISEPVKARLLHNPYWPWFLQTETTSYDKEFSTSIPDELSSENPQFMHTVLNTLGALSASHLPRPVSLIFLRPLMMMYLLISLA